MKSSNRQSNRIPATTGLVALAFIAALAAGPRNAIGGEAEGEVPNMTNVVIVQRVLPVLDFAEDRESTEWSVLNDGVMGGVSQSEIEIGPGATASFRGILSLENNGGFASVRRAGRDYGLAGVEGFTLRVRGDGRRYQFRVQTDDANDGISYRAEFTAPEDGWVRVDIPTGALQATYHGRRVPDAPPLAPDRIRRIGFLIADGVAGPFLLEIARVEAYGPVPERAAEPAR